MAELAIILGVILFAVIMQAIEDSKPRMTINTHKPEDSTDLGAK